MSELGKYDPKRVNKLYDEQRQFIVALRSRINTLEEDKKRHAESFETLYAQRCADLKIRIRVQAVVEELQNCWEQTPNKLEFLIGEMISPEEED
jgi:hypothetical protein